MLTQQIESEIAKGSEQYQAGNSGIHFVRHSLYLEDKVRILLNNHYFIWRHGQSEANVAEVIVSKLENGAKGFGLTEEGFRQVRREATITHLLSRGIFGSDGLIYTSPFLRCLQTAEQIARITGLSKIVVANELRERDFGQLEGKSADWYKEVYQADRIYSDHRLFGVETTQEVLVRARSLIDRLEESYQVRRIILVTHADVGEILMTYFLGLNPQEHRLLPKLQNAKWEDFQAGYIKRGES